MMLTRPPVVFVHGINSDPYGAWQQPGGMAYYLQGQGYVITPFSFADHSGAAETAELIVKEPVTLTNTN